MNERESDGATVAGDRSFDDRGPLRRQGCAWYVGSLRTRRSGRRHVLVDADRGACACGDHDDVPRPKRDG
jgi:hypothetical protein